MPKTYRIRWAPVAFQDLDEIIDYIAAQDGPDVAVSVFAKIKAINKRRKKLYDSEYITHVCETFDLNDDILLAELKDKFETFDKYKDFLWHEK